MLVRLSCPACSICSVSTSLATWPLSFTPRLRYLQGAAKLTLSNKNAASFKHILQVTLPYMQLQRLFNACSWLERLLLCWLLQWFPVLCYLC